MGKVSGLGESRCGLQFRCKQTRRKALGSKRRWRKSGEPGLRLAGIIQLQKQQQPTIRKLQAISALDSKFITKYSTSTCYFKRRRLGAKARRGQDLEVEQQSCTSEASNIRAHGWLENLHIVRMRSKLITRSSIPRCCLSPTADCSPSLPTLDASWPFEFKPSAELRCD
jgi:hypothetical protein